MKEINGLAMLLFSATIILCLIASLQLINIKTTAILLFFNFLFIPLILQLNGSLPKKMFILAIGNVVGLFWNLILYYFSLAGFNSLGPAFNVFYTLIFPILNLMWIVPFWALTLGVLPKQTTKNLADQN